MMGATQFGPTIIYHFSFFQFLFLFTFHVIFFLLINKLLKAFNVLTAEYIIKFKFILLYCYVHVPIVTNGTYSNVHKNMYTFIRTSINVCACLCQASICSYLRVTVTLYIKHILNVNIFQHKFTKASKTE